jgi:hypothetical protein
MLLVWVMSILLVTLYFVAVAWMVWSGTVHSLGAILVLVMVGLVAIAAVAAAGRMTRG